MKTFSLITAVLMYISVQEVSATVFDSLMVECQVVDAETKQPVSAKIRYESEPYGSKVGFRRGASCLFRIDVGESYVINVQAEGYLPATVKIKYDDFAGAGRILEEIELKPSRVGKIMRLESLVFPQASSEITSSAYEELDKLYATLRDNSDMTIQLEGHTDYRGDPKLNLKLSEDRVKAVRDYLVDKGIDRSRINIKAFGGTQPLSTENSAEAHALNRRVEVRILSN